MPGIFGIVASEAKPREELERDVGAMLRVLRHRPTYKEHTHVAENLAVGRIGPGFLNPERQPVFSDDRRFCAVFHGELFEPQEVLDRLKRDGLALPQDAPDSQIVLRAVEAYGISCIAGLAGAYIGFIYDSRTHTGHLFTDRLGLRGCYYHLASDGTFIFASELKAIAALPWFSGELDIQAAAEFLNCGHPFFDRTLFSQVKFLPCGTVLGFQDGRISLQQYWDMPHPDPENKWRFEDALAEARWLLIQAMKRQFRQQGIIAVMLSGGKDSRAIAASAVALGHHVPTFTYTSGRNDDSELAAQVAKRLGLENHRLEIPPDYLPDFGEAGMWLTDAMLPSRELYWMPQLDYIGKHADALFSGYLGDVLLGGHFVTSEYLNAPPIASQRRLIAEKAVSSFSPFVEMALNPSFGQTLKSRLGDSLDQVASFIGERGFAKELGRLYVANHGRRLANLAFGGLWGSVAQVKYPFADYDLVDFSAKLPARWCVGQRFYKTVLSETFPELVDIPCVAPRTKGVRTKMNSQPSALLIEWRKLAANARFLVARLTGGRLNLPPDRSTFTHDAYWYRTCPRLRNWFRAILLDDRTLGRGYFSRRGVERLLREQRVKGYHFGLLSHLVTFEYWNRFFVDGETPLAGNREPEENLTLRS